VGPVWSLYVGDTRTRFSVSDVTLRCTLVVIDGFRGGRDPLDRNTAHPKPIETRLKQSLSLW
jgi:hypothetical protein